LKRNQRHWQESKRDFEEKVENKVCRVNLVEDEDGYLKDQSAPDNERNEVNRLRFIKLLLLFSKASTKRFYAKHHRKSR